MGRRSGSTQRRRNSDRQFVGLDWPRAPIAARTAERRDFVTAHAPLITPVIAQQLSAVIAVVIGMLTLAIIFYREPFQLWKYPLSDLGATVTEHGLPNTPSLVFFDCGMLASSLIMLRISSRFAASKVRNRKIKRGLTLLGAAGFFVIMFPYNISDPVHMTGGGMVFGSLWALTVLLLLETRPRAGRLRFWLLQLLLQLTILPYAALFLLGPPIKQAFQKPAVVGLMLTLRITVGICNKLDLVGSHLRVVHSAFSSHTEKG